VTDGRADGQTECNPQGTLAPPPSGRGVIAA